MTRVAVFSGTSLRRNLEDAEGHGLAYAFFPPLHARPRLPALRGFEGALVELGRGARGPTLQALRDALPGKAVGSLSLRPDAAALRRSARLGFDFHLGSWRSGDPPLPQVLAHFKAFRSREVAASRRLEV